MNNQAKSITQNSKNISQNKSNTQKSNAGLVELELEDLDKVVGGKLESGDL
ncbi:MAG: hypothetical protein F6K22_31425 [Okeania sp. SIO2F4]|uniref:hypothetical protein n=1 Tax=Okeania sp. SIO2F4 TaxID=2607790 RepID=UPI00142C1862|nr:hypothetical protein [Okeania sp. SIO2F4]MDJ0516350.1 hypothetical protein [Trichodesmium sp. MO_231.B1]NES06930.1 hypothetical protein [Okeania sp. SIO2F4]